MDARVICYESYEEAEEGFYDVLTQAMRSAGERATGWTAKSHTADSRTRASLAVSIDLFNCRPRGAILDNELSGPVGSVGGFSASSAAATYRLLRNVFSFTFSFTNSK